MEDGAKFCDQCGSSMISVVDDFKKSYPDDIMIILGMLKDKLETNVRSGPFSKISSQIVSVGDVEISGDLSELEIGNIYTKGKVRINDQKTQNVLSFSYLSQTDGHRVEFGESAFNDEAIIRREGDRVSIYTDYGYYSIDDRDLDSINRRYFSRSCIVILRKGDLFYIYTNNKNNPEYVEIRGQALGESSMAQFGYNCRIIVGGKFEMVVRHS